MKNKINQLEELIDHMSQIAETFEDEQLIEDWTNELFLLKQEYEMKESSYQEITNLIEEEY